jgi:hypothetical protein
LPKTAENLASAFAARAFWLWKNMQNDEESPDSQGEGITESRSDRARRQAEREAQQKARAAAKLRENLMRRKTQSRARRAGEAEQGQGLPAAKTDESS